MRIFIIGFKSSGKTTIGKRLARKLGYNFIDLDDHIEKLNQKTVPQLYTEEGEEEFRKREWEALLDVCKIENAVISTGGGAPCWCDNMNLMLKKGETIYLRMDNDILVGRLKKAARERPIVKNKSSEELREYVEDMKLRCEHHYLRAKHIIDGRDLKVDDLVELINNSINPA